MLRFLRISAALMISTAVAVLAQSSDNCSGQLTVTSEADLAQVASCSIFSGTLIISGPSLTSIALPNWTSLTGTLKVAHNRHVGTVSLEGLETSSGSILLYNNTVLTSVSMPKLKTLGSFEVVTAPNLRHLALPGIDSVDSLRIEDTGLDNSGPVPWTDVRKATNVGVSNNSFLKSIAMPRLSSVANDFMVSANGLMEGKGEGSSLLIGNLTSCANCTFRHLIGLDMTQLTNVTSDLVFVETSLQSLSAPKLHLVGQTLSIVSNNALTNASFPALATIGAALQIANNTALLNVDGFQVLADIGGALDLRGAFTNVSLPLIKSIQGGSTVLSSANFDCSSLTQVKAGTRGKMQCREMDKSARPISATSSDLDSSAGAASIHHRGSALAALILLSGLALMF